MTTTTQTKTITNSMNIEDWVNAHRIPHILIDLRYIEVNGKLGKDYKHQADGRSGTMRSVWSSTRPNTLEMV